MGFEGLKGGGGFLSITRANGMVTMRVFLGNQEKSWGKMGNEEEGETEMVQRERECVRNSGAMNSSKHFWAGVVSAIVSRFFFLVCFCSRKHYLLLCWLQTVDNICLVIFW